MTNKKPQTVVLKDVELFWCKLDPKRPVSPFGKPVWEAQVRTRDKKKAADMKSLGLNVKTDDDDDGIFYKVSLKRKAIFEKTGEPAQPVVVVDSKLMPLDASSVGNGSVGNVQVVIREFSYQGVNGKSAELKAVQLTKHVEFKASANGLAFEDEGEMEVVSAEEGNPDDLY